MAQKFMFEGVFGVRTVLVSDTTPSHVVILNYVISQIIIDVDA